MPARPPTNAELAEQGFLYSLNDIESQDLAFMRLVYNIIGVVVAVFVVLYPFPFLTKRLRSKDEAPQE